MILVFGSINIDLVSRVERIPRPGETVLAPRYDLSFGGKGANQAVAAARAVQAELKVSMASAIGDDDFGRSAYDHLTAQGIDASLVKTTALPTGCAFITVDGAGENAITVASGANTSIQASDIPEDKLAQISVLVLQMEIPFAETAAMAARAHARGIKVILNLAPVPEILPKDLSVLLNQVDVLIVNAHEASAVARSMAVSDGLDSQRIAADLARAHNLVCVVTLGAEGVLAAENGGCTHRIPAPAVTVTDTTGAGDAFSGILAAGLAEGRPLHEALARACCGASLACRSLGAQAAMPQRADLDTAMERFSSGETLA